MSSQQEFNVSSQTRPTPCTLCLQTWPVSKSACIETLSPQHVLWSCNCFDREGRCLVQQVQAQPLPGARFRGGNEYAGTYPAKMSTMVHIFADGARIRARICAPVHVYAGGGGGGGERIRCYTGFFQCLSKPGLILVTCDTTPSDGVPQ